MRSERLLAWAADLVAILYFGWSYAFLSRHTMALGAMIEGLGAQPPVATAFVMAHHAWLYPALFGGAGILVLAKEFWIEDKRMSAVVTFVIALLVLWASDYCRSALFLPLLDVIEKLA